MRRFIILVIDGLGVGAMSDVENSRMQDIGANTFKHVVENVDGLKLYNMEQLGIMNVIDYESKYMKKSKDCTYGMAKLGYFGADSFLGHQEIVGTTRFVNNVEPFSKHIDKMYSHLKKVGYKVDKVGENSQVLLVNDSVIVGDSIEGDLGQIYSITGDLNKIQYDDILNIGRIIREKVSVSRVTVNGCLIGVNKLLSCIEEKEGLCIGINAVKAGVYGNGYKTSNLVLSINFQNQVQYLLSKNNIPVVLIGKTGEIIENPYGKNIIEKDTRCILEFTIEEMLRFEEGFILVNVQETDLAGHLQDVDKYANELRIVDEYLGEIIYNMDGEDILIVTADHGNDPTIGHSKHTREYVPVLIHGKNIKKGLVGKDSTLCDIGNTVLAYYNISKKGTDGKILEIF